MINYSDFASHHSLIADKHALVVFDINPICVFQFIKMEEFCLKSIAFSFSFFFNYWAYKAPYKVTENVVKVWFICPDF